MKPLTKIMPAVEPAKHCMENVQVQTLWFISCIFCLDFLHLPACKEEEEENPGLVQEEPEPPHIKEEQEELLHRPEKPVDEDISSHCSGVEVELESDSEVTEDSDDWEETSGGQSVLDTGTGLTCVGERNWELE